MCMLRWTVKELQKDFEERSFLGSWAVVTTITLLLALALPGSLPSLAPPLKRLYKPNQSPVACFGKRLRAGTTSTYDVGNPAGPSNASTGARCQPKPTYDVCRTEDAQCRLGTGHCPKAGWTIDQFCLVCHSDRGWEPPDSKADRPDLGLSQNPGGRFLIPSPPGGSPVAPPGPGGPASHGPAEALAPLGSATLLPPSLLGNEGKELKSALCILGNGLCPRAGWTIDQYCPLCHN